MFNLNIPKSSSTDLKTEGSFYLWYSECSRKQKNLAELATTKCNVKQFLFMLLFKALNLNKTTHKISFLLLCHLQRNEKESIVKMVINLAIEILKLRQPKTRSKNSLGKAVLARLLVYSQQQRQCKMQPKMVLAIQTALKNKVEVFYFLLLHISMETKLNLELIYKNAISI